MSILEFRVRKLLKDLPREHRPAVISAWEHSDGTLLSFIQELESQTWEYGDLPVSGIIDQLAWDVA